MISDYLELIQQNLKNLLLTNPGERVMDPRFGVGMSTFLFSPNIGVTYELIRGRIESQVNKYMPFLAIKEVLFSSEEDIDMEGTFVNIQIFYFVKPLSISGSLKLDRRLILSRVN